LIPSNNHVTFRGTLFALALSTMTLLTKGRNCTPCYYETKLRPVFNVLGAHLRIGCAAGCGYLETNDKYSTEIRFTSLTCPSHCNANHDHQERDRICPNDQRDRTSPHLDGLLFCFIPPSRWFVPRPQPLWPYHSLKRSPADLVPLLLTLHQGTASDEISNKKSSADAELDPTRRPE
jgi:hypothetical protein